MLNLKPYLKAVVGFVTPGVVALGAAIQDGSPGGTAITNAEWVTIAVAMVGTGALVFGVPNKVQRLAPVEVAPLAADPKPAPDATPDATPAPEPAPEPAAPADTPPAPAEDPVKAQLKAAIETVRAQSNATNDARAAAAKAAVDASA